MSLSQVDNATDIAVKPNIITKEPEITEILQDNESKNENEKVRNLKNVAWLMIILLLNLCAFIHIIYIIRSWLSHVF